MRSAHITRHMAEAQLDGTEFDDVSAVQEASALAWERAELAWDEALDHAAEDVELVLTLAEQAEVAAYLASESNQVRASRSRRRSTRRALRPVPVLRPAGFGEVAA